MIEGLIAFMDAPDGLTGPINLGNPMEMPILEIAQTVVAKTGSGSGIVHEPLPQDDPRQRQPDISAAKNKLGWQPTTSLDAGLEQTIG
jgi:UDP-glucuronate decarboxylase